MSYDALERSIESGRPVYLYQFSLGVIAWRFTSADETLFTNGFTWVASAISDDGISQSGEPGSDTLTITMPSNTGPALEFMGTPPSRPIQIAILRKHEGDDEAVVVYSGEISQVDFPAPGIASIACITTSATMQRDGLRLGWQRLCPYALYDPHTCKVDKSAYAVDCVINAVSGSDIAVSTTGGHESPYFNGGFIEWFDAIRGYESRMIEQQSGIVFLMFGPTDDIPVGSAAKLYPRCARTTTACAAFNNLLNYGGCPFMPGKSPFDGTPVF